MRVALIQFGAGGNKSKNVVRAAALVRRAARKGAEFILLPELFVFRGVLKDVRRRQEIAEKIPGPTCRVFQKIAREHRVFILAGSLFERADGSHKVYNTSVLIDPRGRVRARYRKRHLFDARLEGKRLRESDTFLAGTKNATARVHGFKVGLSVCYDLRFSQQYAQYARCGVDVLCVPSAFTHVTGRAHWEVLVRARAIENFCYVLAPNQIGRGPGGVRHYGHSLVVDPWGTILAHAPAVKEKILYADLCRKALTECRARLPGRAKNISKRGKRR